MTYRETKLDYGQSNNHEWFEFAGQHSVNDLIPLEGKNSKDGNDYITDKLMTWFRIAKLGIYNY